MTAGRPALFLGLLLLTGCVRTVANVATAPVRVASWGVDKMTTSQKEADRNRGRRERKADERARKEERREAKRQREDLRRQREQARRQQLSGS